MKRAICEKKPLADKFSKLDVPAILGERPFFKFFTPWATYLLNQKPIVRNQVLECMLLLETTGEYVRPTNAQAYKLMETFVPGIMKGIVGYLGKSAPMPADPVTGPMPEPMPEPMPAEPQRPATATAPQVQPMPTPVNIPLNNDIEKVPESIRNAFKNCTNFDEYSRLKIHYSGWNNNKEYQQILQQYYFEEDLPF